MYHSKGKDYLIVDEREIWACLDDNHKAHIKSLVKKFNASVRFIKSGDKVIFKKRVNR